MKRSLASPLRIALLAALLASSGPALGQEAVIAKLASYDGTLDVIRAGIPLALYPELPLFSGDVIHTRQGRATLRFEDKTEIRLKANTRLSISERKERRDVDVFFGRLWAFIVGQKEKTTAFKTGGTIAAVRGTTIEYVAYADGSVEMGVVTGVVQMILTAADGSTSTLDVQAGQRVTISPRGAVSPPAPFNEGDIFEAGGTRAEVPPSMSAPGAVPPPPPPPPPAPPAGQPVEPTPAAVEPPPEEGAEVPTQGDYAIKLVNALGISQALPPSATAKDAMDFLARLGLYPCDNEWVEDKPIELRDLLCIAGIDFRDPNAPLTMPLEDMIARIIEIDPQLFWLQIRRKQTISPFAP
jgi:hypothetical protein